MTRRQTKRQRQTRSNAMPTAAVDENSLPAIPDLRLATCIHHLSTEHLAPLHEAANKQLQDAIAAEDAAPLYKHVYQELSLPGLGGKFDQSTYDAMAEKNKAKLAEFDEAYQKCKEEEGDMEMLAVLRNKAEYLAKICDHTAAKEAYKEVYAQTATAGSKIDLCFARLRLSLFFNDVQTTTSVLAETATLIEKGGDWDRRNRLKAYRGVFELSRRQFSEAAGVLLDTLSTFTSTELCSYADVVRYALTAGLIALPRTEIKSKIMDAPEVLALQADMPDLVSCVNSLYLCDYKTFFTALGSVQQSMLADRYLCAHAQFYVLALRIKAYNQLLSSYSSLSLTSMASSFGVSVEWLDADLARFIRAGKIQAVIDRVNGIVETRSGQAGGKSVLYEQVIREGDKLLNKLQKHQNALVL
ncbi:26S proteasome subunit RPN7-domain-containing protein [Protomyces lactucae-debilis]|uniref:26S proteasome subunit RPN7-domain-containing protein n=1 Tax=Protomyces lactucae-debilis TaxID=2754530 RepID=A0A1Y2EXC5_PROLT|nr:26S proteasome subunit RPN7-domain-containing protein [Protomyces lactucae-debilis]ORY75465.1 26S proteasome subunit RPN7-domain-containing protein [Protomyces lactucae-debilis]